MKAQNGDQKRQAMITLTLFSVAFILVESAVINRKTIQNHDEVHGRRKRSAFFDIGGVQSSLSGKLDHQEGIKINNPLEQLPKLEVGGSSRLNNDDNRGDIGLDLQLGQSPGPEEKHFEGESSHQHEESSSKHTGGSHINYEVGSQGIKGDLGLNLQLGQSPAGHGHLESRGKFGGHLHEKPSKHKRSSSLGHLNYEMGNQGGIQGDLGLNLQHGQSLGAAGHGHLKEKKLNHQYKKSLKHAGHGGLGYMNYEGGNRGNFQFGQSSGLGGGYLEGSGGSSYPYGQSSMSNQFSGNHELSVDPNRPILTGKGNLNVAVPIAQSATGTFQPIGSRLTPQTSGPAFGSNLSDQENDEALPPADVESRFGINSPLRLLGNGLHGLLNYKSNRHYYDGPISRIYAKIQRILGHVSQFSRRRYTRYLDMFSRIGGKWDGLKHQYGGNYMDTHPQEFNQLLTELDGNCDEMLGIFDRDPSHFNHRHKWNRLNNQYGNRNVNSGGRVDPEVIAEIFGPRTADKGVESNQGNSKNGLSNSFNQNNYERDADENRRGLNSRNSGAEMNLDAVNNDMGNQWTDGKNSNQRIKRLTDDNSRDNKINEQPVSVLNRGSSSLNNDANINLKDGESKKSEEVGMKLNTNDKDNLNNLNTISSDKEKFNVIDNKSVVKNEVNDQTSKEGSERDTNLEVNNRNGQSSSYSALSSDDGLESKKSKDFEGVEQSADNSDQKDASKEKKIVSKMSEMASEQNDESSNGKEITGDYDPNAGKQLNTKSTSRSGYSTSSLGDENSSEVGKLNEPVHVNGNKENQNDDLQNSGNDNHSSSKTSSSSYSSSSAAETEGHDGALGGGEDLEKRIGRSKVGKNKKSRTYTSWSSSTEEEGEDSGQDEGLKQPSPILGKAENVNDNINNKNGNEKFSTSRSTRDNSYSVSSSSINELGGQQDPGLKKRGKFGDEESLDNSKKAKSANKKSRSYSTWSSSTEEEGSGVDGLKQTVPLIGNRASDDVSNQENDNHSSSETSSSSYSSSSAAETEGHDGALGGGDDLEKRIGKSKARKNKKSRTYTSWSSSTEEEGEDSGVEGWKVPVSVSRNKADDMSDNTNENHSTIKTSSSSYSSSSSSSDNSNLNEDSLKPVKSKKCKLSKRLKPLKDSGSSKEVEDLKSKRHPEEEQLNEKLLSSNIKQDPSIEPKCPCNAD